MTQLACKSEAARDGSFRRGFRWRGRWIVCVIVEPDILSWDWHERNCRRWRFNLQMFGWLMNLGYRYRAWFAGPRMVKGPKL
ncbi:MAG: hypothetical protein DI527_18815 [Chelatococcus sp.]|nr:MAG: hypothetical protein DI527_18815 [Chelatococcus sp.]